MNTQYAYIFALVCGLAAMVTFPMGPLYRANPAVTHAQLVGKRVVVSTSRVTEIFGEAERFGGSRDVPVVCVERAEHNLPFGL